LDLIAFWAPNWYELPPEIAAAARQLDGEVYLLIPAPRKKRSRAERRRDA
jgi:hypothetical protein